MFLTGMDGCILMIQYSKTKIHMNFMV